MAEKVRSFTQCLINALTGNLGPSTKMCRFYFSEI
jgi:hypothetical protein